MAKPVRPAEPNLPWVDHSEDRGFKVLAIIMLLLFLGAGVFLNLIKLPEIERKNLVDVSPRLAKLILEKKKVEPPPPPPPPPPKKEEVKKKEEPKPEKKEEVKKKEEPKPEKKDAREVAKQSGLIALADELEDLRESFDLDASLELPQQNDGKQALKVATSSDLLTSAAGQSSGGIKTDTLNRTIRTSELAQRQTTKVESKIESSQQLAKATAAKQQAGSGSGGVGKRTPDEIERVFQTNRGKIDLLYQRALRSNPGLAGKVVVELTIAPGGQVTAVNIISSELGDEALERKLALRIKRFKFTSANVAEITVTYPIDFLPS